MPIDSHLSYLEKHALLTPLIEAEPEAGLGIVIALHGSDAVLLKKSLQAIDQCAQPPVPVEVLIVFHAGEAMPEADRSKQSAAREVAADWIATVTTPGFRYYILDLPDVAPRDWGEGLTRKLSFDEGMRRLHAADNPSGLLLWLDAGVLIDFIHLTELYYHFQKQRRMTSCTLDFYSHQQPEELTLRYAMQGLRSMRHPHAYYHLASAVAVRGTAYEQSSGMNRRKAGADFHFLHKLTPLGLHGECSSARIIYLGPVPGLKAQEMVFAPEAYRVLGQFAESVLTNWELPAMEVVSLAEDVHPAIAPWMAEHRLLERIAGMQASARHAATFRQRFFHWFSLLQVQHFMHFAHPAYFELVPLHAASAAILGMPIETDRLGLLAGLRSRDHQPYSNSL